MARVRVWVGARVRVRVRVGARVRARPWRTARSLPSSLPSLHSSTLCSRRTWVRSARAAPARPRWRWPVRRPAAERAEAGWGHLGWSPPGEGVEVGIGVGFQGGRHLVRAHRGVPREAAVQRGGGARREGVEGRLEHG
eukprot:scaffold17604_cov53-Phaeocystis_antarctica.AAC.8